jgi:hypothetical protein
MEATMKSTTSLIFGVLVLILTSAGTSPAHAAAAPAVNAPPATASTPVLPASFLCSLNQPVDPGLAKTDSLIPAPKTATTFPPPCGPCSDFVCQGRSIGAVCGLFNPPHHCYDLEEICQPTGEAKCRCLLNVP